MNKRSMFSKQVSLGIAVVLFILVGCLYTLIRTPAELCYRDITLNTPTSRSTAEGQIEYSQNVRRFIGENISANDPELLKFLRQHVISEPSTEMYKISHKMLMVTKQSELIDKLFNGKKNLFFVECGALDGERSSNTLWLEIHRGWRGLLVEMDPFFYMQLQGKNRKSYSVNGCLSPSQHPTQMEYVESDGGLGTLVGVPGLSAKGKRRKVTCFPLYSYLLALNRTQVDYFSLDVEGAETKVLMTIPWNKLNIKVLTVEYAHVPGGEKLMTEYMESQGYRVHSKVHLHKPEIDYFVDDLVFIKNGVKLNE